MIDVSASSAPKMASVPIVVERFNDGMTLAKDAFANNIVLTEFLKAFVATLAAQIRPLNIAPLIPAPTYEELDTLFNLSVPTAPAAVDFPPLPALDIPTPSTQFAYNESNYISPVGNALQTSVAEKLAAGGTGLGADIENDIWNREQERALLERAEAIARLEDDVAAGGFSLPDGVVATMLLDQHTKFNDQRLTSSRDIATKQAEIAHDQQTKILEVGVSYEGVNTSYATAMRNRLLEAAKAGPQIAVDIFKAAVERVNIYVAQYNALAQKANAQAEVFKAQILGYTSEIDTKAKIVDASARVYSSKVEGVYRSNEAEIQQETLLLEQIKQFLALQLEALKAETQVNAQIAASALTGISASASIGGSESQSFSLSEVSSDSDSHIYDMTKQIPEG